MTNRRLSADADSKAGAIHRSAGVVAVAIFAMTFGWYVRGSFFQPIDNDSAQAVRFAERYCGLSEDSQRLLDEHLIGVPGRVQLLIGCGDSYASTR